MDYQIAWNAATKKATVQEDGDALPDGSTKIGTFKHDDAADGLGASDVNENHVWYHHVRDALYHQGVENMQGVTIESDTDYVALAGITATPDPTNLAPAATQQIAVTYDPVGASNQNVTYESDDEAVATVSETGLITAVAVGNATITVTSEDGGFTDTITVNVA